MGGRFGQVEDDSDDSLRRANTSNRPTPRVSPGRHTADDDSVAARLGLTNADAETYRQLWTTTLSVILCLSCQFFPIFPSSHPVDYLSMPGSILV